MSQGSTPNNQAPTRHLRESSVEHLHVPLPASKIRWYFSKAKFAGTAPGTAPDLAQRGDWLWFAPADSLKLERHFREEREDIEGVWWGEVADASLGGTQANKKPDEAGEEAPDPCTFDSDSDDGITDDPRTATGRRPFDCAKHVLVRSGTMQVDLYRRRATYCYWKGEPLRVRRGTWFVERSPGEWLPLSENVADQLEEAYRSQVWRPEMGMVREQPEGIVAARLQLTVLTHRSLYALFSSEGEAWLHVDDVVARMKRAMSIARGAPGLRLRRGWLSQDSDGAGAYESMGKAEDLEELHALSQRVAGVVMKVHGVGQMMAQADAKGDTLLLRKHTNEMVLEMLGREGVLETGRIEFLPIQWRRNLNLPGDSLLPHIMPPGVRGLREFVSLSGGEVLLFLSPVHGPDLMRSVGLNLNRMYRKFVRRNPNFTGPINVVAHSLGSVAMWDLLCNQPRYAAAAHRAFGAATERMARARRSGDAADGAGGRDGSGRGAQREAGSHPASPLRVSQSPQGWRVVGALQSGQGETHADRRAELMAGPGTAPASAQSSPAQRFSSGPDRGLGDGSRVGHVAAYDLSHPRGPEGGGAGGAGGAAAPQSGEDWPMDCGEGGHAGGDGAQDDADDTLSDMERILGDNAARDSLGGDGVEVSLRGGSWDGDFRSAASHGIPAGPQGPGQHGRSRSVVSLHLDFNAASGDGAVSVALTPHHGARRVLGPRPRDRRSLDMTAHAAIREGPESEDVAEVDAVLEALRQQVHERAARDAHVSELVEDHVREGEGASGAGRSPEEELHEARSATSAEHGEGGSATRGPAPLLPALEGLWPWSRAADAEGGSGVRTPQSASGARVSGSKEGGSGRDQGREKEEEGTDDEARKSREELAWRRALHRAWGHTLESSGMPGGRGHLLGPGGVQTDYVQLDFQVDQLINVGSPLGLFLLVRGVTPEHGRGLGSEWMAHVLPRHFGGVGDGLPAATRMYNLYHPFDAIAYRLEPLVDMHAMTMRACLAPYHKGGKRIHHALAEMTEDVYNRASGLSQSVSQGLASIGSSARWLVEAVSFRKQVQGGVVVESADDVSETPALDGTHDGPVCFMDRLAGGPCLTSGRGSRGRLDFMLQETLGESTISIYSALSAHFMYWDSPDVGLFVARAVLGRDVAEEAKVSGAPKAAEVAAKVAAVVEAAKEGGPARGPGMAGAAAGEGGEVPGEVVTGAPIMRELATGGGVAKGGGQEGKPPGRAGEGKLRWFSRAARAPAVPDDADVEMEALPRLGGAEGAPA